MYKLKDNELGLSFGYAFNGLRIVVLADIINLLRERKLDKLAEEITIRGREAFDKIDNSSAYNLEIKKDIKL